MNKDLFFNNLQIIILFVVTFCILSVPGIIYSGTYYNCIDKEGGVTLSSYPIDGQECKKVRTYEENTPRKNLNKISTNERETKIIVRGNHVFVPVKIVHENNEVDVHLLMDTGAGGTTINTEVADDLYINLRNAATAKAKVVGGSIIDVSVVRVSSLSIGPHTVRNWNIAVVPEEGDSDYDGLLGMDILGRFSFKVDMAKQVIIWR